MAAVVGHHLHQHVGHFGAATNGQLNHQFLSRQSSQPLHRVLSFVIYSVLQRMMVFRWVEIASKRKRRGSSDWTEV
ncbi:hypothetical protein L1887_17363 [Cichorium endivia]|nr:hypothetical protein L1887_17363 [Cichorium endivia]